MSRASISTGNLLFDTRSDNQSSEQTSNTRTSFDIVILADFSGRGHRNLNEAHNLKNRRIIKIDRDNFDDIFEQMNVQCDLPLANGSIRFSDIDDMHPDVIYESVPLFDKFKQLKRKLKSTSTFEAAAAEIRQWGTLDQLAPRQKPEAIQDIPSSLLDDLLSAAEPAIKSKEFDVQDLIKDIMAPYITPKANPNQKDFIQAVDDASSDLMRKLMHHHDFKNIESAWRSLYLLVRRIETSSTLNLFIVDISQQELIEDALTNDSHTQHGIYKLLVDQRQSAGATPFSVIMSDMTFGETESDIKTLSDLGEIAESINADFIAGGSEKLAGCQSLGLTPDKDDWDFSHFPDITEKWQQLRSEPQAQYLNLVATRYLTRMPYGKRTSPIDSFAFEELPEDSKHAYYLWSCGAWLLTLSLAKQHTQATLTTSEIDRLPLHVYQEEGEEKITPCAEIHMVDSTANALRQAGLLSIRSVLNRDSVLVPKLTSIYIPEAEVELTDAI